MLTSARARLPVSPCSFSLPFTRLPNTLPRYQKTRQRLPGHAHPTRSIRTAPAYEGHIPLNWFENAVLAVGSAFMSLADPRRGGVLCFFHNWTFTD